MANDRTRQFLDRSPEEAAAFVKTLQAILRHVGASDANMEKVCALPVPSLRCRVEDQGSDTDSPFFSFYRQPMISGFQGELRCDVNVSVAKIGEDGQVEQEGTRCEVKNLNGVRFIAGAVGASFFSSFPLFRRL